MNRVCSHLPKALELLALLVLTALSIGIATVLVALISSSAAQHRHYEVLLVVGDGGLTSAVAQPVVAILSENSSYVCRFEGILLGGSHVGHLSREEAEAFRRVGSRLFASLPQDDIVVLKGEEWATFYGPVVVSIRRGRLESRCLGMWCASVTHFYPTEEDRKHDAVSPLLELFEIVRKLFSSHVRRDVPPPFHFPEVDKEVVRHLRNLWNFLSSTRHSMSLAEVRDFRVAVGCALVIRNAFPEGLLPAEPCTYVRNSLKNAIRLREVEQARQHSASENSGR